MTRIYGRMADGRGVKDRSMYAQCRTCFWPMIGILSVKAREDCHGCGGEALNVNNEEPSEPAIFAKKADRLRGYPRPSPQRRL